MRRAYSTLIRVSNQKMLLLAEQNGYQWQTIRLKYIFLRLEKS